MPSDAPSNPFWSEFGTAFRDAAGHRVQETWDGLKAIATDGEVRQALWDRAVEGGQAVGRYGAAALDDPAMVARDARDLASRAYAAVPSQADLEQFGDIWSGLSPAERGKLLGEGLGGAAPDLALLALPLVGRGVSLAADGAAGIARGASAAGRGAAAFARAEEAASLAAESGTATAAAKAARVFPAAAPEATQPCLAATERASAEALRRVRLMPKGMRPDPRSYLSPAEIDQHLAQFDHGGSYLVPKRALDRYGRDALGMPDNSQFIMPKAQMDDLLRRSGGDMAAIELELGIPPGAWQGQDMVRIDVPAPRGLNLRMPSGNEAGANDLWLPGGKLPTGQAEAVIDRIPRGSYVESPL